MRFVAMDAEAASTEMPLICQVGIAKFNNGDPSDSCSEFINPEDAYNTTNYSIHGIYTDTVSLRQPLSEAARTAHTVRSRDAIASQTGADHLLPHRLFTQIQTKADQVLVADVLVSTGRRKRVRHGRRTGLDEARSRSKCSKHRKAEKRTAKGSRFPVIRKGDNKVQAQAVIT